MKELTEVIDISVPVHEEMVIWPGDPEPRLEAIRTVAADRVRATRLTVGTHTGTHLDAPAHFIAGGASIDEIPLSTFAGPCRVEDLSHVEDAIGVRDIEALDPQPGERLLLRTRNSALYAERRFVEDFVHLSVEAADVLAARRVRLVGIDYLSVEAYAAEEPRAHYVLLGAGIAILETLNLAHVVPGAYLLVAAPLRLRAAEAAPTRALLIRP